MKIINSEPLSKHTTLNLGGPAKYFAEAISEKELLELINFAQDQKVPYLIIGWGSNLLVSDSGFNGLVIKNTIKQITIKDSIITAGSGTRLGELVDFTLEKGFSGMEKLSGIPGTVGGAVCGNSGAYGQSISDYLIRVKVFNGKKIIWMDKNDCEFNYHDSGFKRNKFVIIAAEFKLKKDFYKKAKDESGKIINERLKKFPPEMKCPGSFFKNIPVSNLTKEQLIKIPKDKIVFDKVPAGYLLEQVGAREMKKGGIKVAPYHANLFLNDGKGTAKQLYNLAMELKGKVKEKFGIGLEPEVQIIGFDKRIENLRKKYPEFIYKKYSWRVEKDNLIIDFDFSIPPEINFKPRLIIKDIIKEKFDQIDKNIINQFVFNLGLIEIPSYWKITCSQEIIIKAGHLDDYQIIWWKDLILNGMGQFFYENKIDFMPKDFISIKSTGKKVGFVPILKKTEGVLIPVGGGKDSVVTLELLKNEQNIGVFIINPTKASSEIIKEAGIGNVIEIERKMDEKLFELNNQGFLNGHTPFSAIVAFLSVFCADLFGYEDIALSNERSADEENTIYLGKKINHQYSKTFDFENKFQEYSKKYLSKVNYFSFLRPLYEIQISKIFSKMDKYFGLIRSCNVGQKTNTWCCKCPKCLSTFILLYPFLGKGKILRIFPENLFQKEGLKTLLNLLISKDKIKPFECVGTKEELRLAFEKKDLSVILNAWGPNNLDKKYEGILKRAL